MLHMPQAVPVAPIFESVAGISKCLKRHLRIPVLNGTVDLILSRILVLDISKGLLLYIFFGESRRGLYIVDFHTPP